VQMMRPLPNSKCCGVRSRHSVRGIGRVLIGDAAVGWRSRGHWGGGLSRGLGGDWTRGGGGGRGGEQADVVGSAVCVLSGIARLVLRVGHAAKGGRRTTDWCRAGWSRNADVAFADCWVLVSAIAVGIGVAADRNNWGG